ncbi:MAG: STAS domain-containing protein [Pyrinomonadaceae bacterium]
MATQINQIDDAVNGRTILRVSGELHHEDAVLLERIASAVHDQNKISVVIDLAEIDFLDSEAAPILKRLSERDGYAIEGIEIFLQSTIDQAERQSI